MNSKINFEHELVVANFYAKKKLKAFTKIVVNGSWKAIPDHHNKIAISVNSFVQLMIDSIHNMMQPCNSTEVVKMVKDG